MNKSKDKNQKESDQVKDIIKLDQEISDENNEFQNIIPSDSILAEKDEVKNAEERLRRKKEEEKGES